jgi:8-oxo-dGTP pyrophosphatase MutT (NUDIX family)
LPRSRVDFLSSISKTLREDEPIRRVPSETAAVALILRTSPEAGDEVLLIRRAEREGDPWSGQIAFPGGRVEDADSCFRDTAVRETMEEVGIDLREGGGFAGYMRALQARTRSIWVVPCVFFPVVPLEVASASQEVASTRWVSISRLASPESRSSFTLNRGGENLSFPAIEVDDFMIWGLTERILSVVISASAEKDPASAGSG